MGFFSLIFCISPPTKSWAVFFFCIFSGLSLENSTNVEYINTVDKENRKANSGRKEVKMFEVVKKAFRRLQRRKAERMKIRQTVKLAKITGTIR